MTVDDKDEYPTKDIPVEFEHRLPRRGVYKDLNNNKLYMLRGFEYFKPNNQVLVGFKEINDPQKYTGRWYDLDYFFSDASRLRSFVYVNDQQSRHNSNL